MRDAATKATLLADDVLIVSAGSRMVGKLAQTLNQTHEYLHDMGSTAAPNKRFTFSSPQKTRSCGALHQVAKDLVLLFADIRR